MEFWLKLRKNFCALVETRKCTLENSEILTKVEKEFLFYSATKETGNGTIETKKWTWVNRQILTKVEKDFCTMVQERW